MDEKSIILKYRRQNGALGVESFVKKGLEISRREFLAGMGLGVAVLSGAGVWASRSPVISFAEPTFAQGKSKILVAYCSKYGSTGEVAASIGDTIHQEGFKVDVRRIANLNDISEYRAVVIGAPIHSNRWMAEAAAFLERHRQVLAKLPVAYFLTCMTLGLTKEEKARTKIAAAFADIKHKYPEILPIDTAMFAGTLDYSKMSVLMQTMYKVFAEDGRSGDYRNWQSIAAWAKQVAVKIS